MRRAVLLTVILACLPAPAVAGAAPRDVVRDCTDNGRMDSYHSQSDYKGALRRLPTDVEEYTECRQIIQAARRRDARRPAPGGGGTGSGFGGGGGFFGGFDGGGAPPPALNVPASPAEARALTQAAGAGAAPVTVAGEPITPGGAGIVEAAFRHDLPAPLLVVMLLFGLGALASAVSGARGRGMQPPGAVLRVFDRVFPRRA